MDNPEVTVLEKSKKRTAKGFLVELSGEQKLPIAGAVGQPIRRPQGRPSFKLSANLIRDLKEKRLHVTSRNI
jgi:hypothetical protein